MDDARWRAGPALHRAVALLGLLLGAALVLGAPVLVALAAPMLVGTLMGLVSGPRRPGVPFARAVAPRSANQGARVPVRVQVSDADGGQLAVVRLPRGRALPHAQLVATAVVDGGAVLESTAELTRWGPVAVARPDLLVAGPDALLLNGPQLSLERRVAVLPLVERVPPTPLPPRAAGLVGAHRTRRPGEGSDLLDVREFLPGDRIRRIDWRVSARRGSLHVRRTAVDADAEVVLCLDTRYDVGRDVARWPSPPGLGVRGSSEPGHSLDVAVRATVSLAEAFLRQGDRVSFVDLSRPTISVGSGSGVRHLRRIRLHLSDVGVHLQARRLVLRPGAVPPSAFVVLISPMLDESVADLATMLRRRGADLLVVDVLPQPLEPPHRSRAELTAHRLLQAERRLRLGSLQRHGVMVTRWDPAAVPLLLRRRARQRRRAAS